MKDAEEYCPSDQKDWREWLRRHHNDKQEVWLVFFKKNSPQHNLSWGQSVDEALCFGWIDSTIRPIDETTYKQYFCRRKAKSNWSKVNKEKVKNLIEQGLMQEAGFKSIEIAKENGSWTILDEVEEVMVPEDLKAALEGHKGAVEYFDGLSKSVKKILLYRVVSAKRKETRQNRILEIAVNAAQNLTPKQFRQNKKDLP